MDNTIKQLLIVEDSLEDQALYQRYLLKLYGNTIHIENTEKAENALHFILKNEVDCVLLDYNLPDMSGVEFLQKLSEMNIEKKPPVIILTGEGNENVAVKSLKSGAYDYLVKGDLQPEILHKAISNAVEKSVLTRQIRDKDEEIKYIAYHDHLTGVPNRTQFENLATQAIAKANRSASQLAVLMLDLDYFKEVNDSLGHETGDLLLKKVVKRFQGVLRESDILCRLGGDEFAILIDPIEQPKDADIVSSKLLQALKGDFLLNGHKVHIAASIGISIYPTSGVKLSELLRNADVALYEAKNTGRNTFCFFSEVLHHTQNKKAYLEKEVMQAIKEKTFSLNFQPIYKLKNNEIFAVEVLLRWAHVKLGSVPPNQIIEITKTNDLVISLTRWIIEKSLSQYKKWISHTKTPFKLAINISPKQITNPLFIGEIKKIIANYEVDPKHIIFEIAETDIVSEIDEINRVLNILAKMGIEIYIDNFGARYSALNLIKKLPISGLKINQSFIQNAEEDPKNAALVDSLFALTKNMSLSVVASCIETEKQLNTVKQLGTVNAQGFLLSKPLTAEELTKKIEGATKS